MYPERGFHAMGFVALRQAQVKVEEMQHAGYEHVILTPKSDMRSKRLKRPRERARPAPERHHT